jgi:ABC-type Mn2+/Zn2+ transport system permease subunit
MTIERTATTGVLSPTRVAASLPLLLAAMLLVAAGSAAATTPSPPDAEAATVDALREIGAIQPTPAADQPGGPAATGGAGGPPTRAASRWCRWAGLVAFFAPVLVVAAAVGVSGSIVGTFVLLRRDALVALALPQVVAVGAAVGLRNGWPTLPPAAAAAAGGLAYLSWTRRGAAGHAGSAAARMAAPALYVGGLCVSFLVIAGSGAHVEELQHLFTGVDVAVTPAEAAVVAPIMLAAGLACAAAWRRWLVLAQTPAAAELAGRSPARTDALFLFLLAAVLVLGTNAQGVVMVLAMLFLPAAVVQPWARRVPTALAAAVAVALLCLAAAFVAATALDWPLSQTAGGVGCAALAISRAAAGMVRRH